MFKPSILLTGCLLFAQFGRAGEALPICFIPGVGGMTDLLAEDLPAQLAVRGVRFRAYDVAVKRGNIQAKAERFARHLERELRADPEFRCHGMAHSMGGIVGRYALAHVEVIHPTRGRIPLREILPTFTTVSTPHRGTPFADLLHRYFPWVNPAATQLSEAEIETFNDPRFPETYSPEMPGTRYFSYRSFVRSAKQTLNPLEYLGFALLWVDLLTRHRDPFNDGVIPLDAQVFGEVLGDIEKPHAYFADRTRLNPPAAEFYADHARFLGGL